MNVGDEEGKKHIEYLDANNVFDQRIVYLLYFPFPFASLSKHTTYIYIHICVITYNEILCLSQVCFGSSISHIQIKSRNCDINVIHIHIFNIDYIKIEESQTFYYLYIHTHIYY